MSLSGVEEGQTMHLVQGASAASPAVVHQGGSPTSAGQGSPAPPGLGFPPGNMQSMQQQMMNNPDMIRSMMNSPMMQSIMNNPEIMRSLIQSNPQMQAIIEQNPEIGHVLNDPAVLRQTLEAARSPELMREMMRTSDRAMSNIESHPEGFNMLRRMYHTVQEPLMDAAVPGARATNGESSAGSAPTVDPSNPFADLFQVFLLARLRRSALFTKLIIFSVICQ
jgi:ubiquilin